jgi:hypothetical protein
MEAQIEDRADSPDNPMNDREIARNDTFQRAIAKRGPARETRCAAARIEHQATVGRGLQKIFNST